MTLSQEVRVELVPKAPLVLKGELNLCMLGAGQAGLGLVPAWRSPWTLTEPSPWPLGLISLIVKKEQVLRAGVS